MVEWLRRERREPPEKRGLEGDRIARIWCTMHFVYVRRGFNCAICVFWMYLCVCGCMYVCVV